MATFRTRPSGTVEVTFRRKGLLPGPIYLTFSDMPAAEDYAAKVEAFLSAGIVPDALKDMAAAPRAAPMVATLADTFKRYKREFDVRQCDSDVLDTLAEEVGKTRIEEVTTQWALDLVAGYKAKKRKPQTILHKIGAMSRCFDWLAFTKHEIALNPLRLLPKRYASYNDHEKAALEVDYGQNDRDRRLEEGDEARIRKVLAGDKGEKERGLNPEYAPDMALLFDLALETAMRLREMYTLTTDQIDVSKKTIFLDKTKNGDKRQVPLTSVALEIVKLRLADCKAGPIFPKIWEGDLSKQGLRKTTSRLSGRWRTVAQLAKCHDLRFHDLRHEATSRIFERTNLSDTEISRITGHRDPRCLRRYANIRASTLAERMW